MYKVIKYFTDLQDNNFAYQVGDVFPHDGKEVSDNRLLELSTSRNRRGEALIEKVEDAVEAPAEPAEDFMNPPVIEDEGEVIEKPKKKRGRPRNDE